MYFNISMSVLIGLIILVLLIIAIKILSNVIVKVFYNKYGEESLRLIKLIDYYTIVAFLKSVVPTVYVSPDNYSNDNTPIDTPVWDAKYNSVKRIISVYDQFINDAKNLLYDIADKMQPNEYANYFTNLPVSQLINMLDDIDNKNHDNVSDYHDHMQKYRNGYSITHLVFMELNCYTVSILYYVSVMFAEKYISLYDYIDIPVFNKSKVIIFRFKVMGLDYDNNVLTLNHSNVVDKDLFAEYMCSRGYFNRNHNLQYESVYNELVNNDSINTISIEINET